MAAVPGGAAEKASTAAGLPELVRDSRLEAEFLPNADAPTQTVHRHLIRRRTISEEVWSRKKRLGGGGFGILWLEQSDVNGALRAVKELRKQRSNGGTGIVRDCVRELEALAKFSQRKYADFFTTSYGWYESPDALFIAMEYLHHGDLRSHLNSHGELSECHAQDVVWQLARGLVFMHSNGFAHRDLKPENILILSKPPDGEWHVKICDLGLSKRHTGEFGPTTLKFTPGFAPPELYTHRDIGSSGRPDPLPGDIWCLGETTAQLLTNKSTFASLLDILDYSRGSQELPIQHPRTEPLSHDAIQFLESTMAAKPDERMTALQTLQHAWLETTSAPVTVPAVSNTSVPGTFSASYKTETLMSGPYARWTTLGSTCQASAGPTEEEREFIAAQSTPSSHTHGTGSAALSSGGQYSEPQCGMSLGHDHSKIPFKCLQVLRPHGSRVSEGHYQANQLAFSADGEQVISFLQNDLRLPRSVLSTVTKWDLRTGKSDTNGFEIPYWPRNPSPDGTCLPVVHLEGIALHYIEPGTQVVLKEPPSVVTISPKPTANSIRRSAFSSDGQQIALGNDAGQILILDLNQLACTNTFKTDERGITHLAFSRDDHQLLASSSPNRISIWDPRRGVNIGNIYTQSGFFQKIVFSPDGRNIIGVAMDNPSLLVGWDTVKGTRLWSHQCKDHIDNIFPLSPDGGITIAVIDRTVRIFDIKKGTVLQTLEPPEARKCLIAAASFHEATRQLAVELLDETIEIWGGQDSQ